MRLMIWFAAIFLAAGAATADEFRVTPSVAVRQEYNDNIFFDAKKNESDAVTTVTAGVKVSDRTEILNWHVLGEAAPFFYWNHGPFNEIDQRYQGRLTYQVTPRLDVNADAGVRVDNRPDREIQETGLVFGANRRLRVNAGAGAGYATSEIQHLSASYAYQSTDWAADDLNRSDYRGHSVTLGSATNISRWLRETSLLTNLGYSWYDYDRADIQSTYGTVGIQRMLSEIFRLQASAGVRYTATDFQAATLVLVPPGVLRVQYEDQHAQDWGGVGSVGLDYLGERTRSNLTASYDFRPGSGTNGPSNLLRLSFDVNHRLQERFSLGLGTGYYINKADAKEYYGVPIDEETVYVRPRLRWAFMDHFTLEGAYTYTYVRDNEADLSRDQHVVYLEFGWVLAFGR